MNRPDFEALAERFRRPGVKAIALMGSRAGDEAGPFSDVDLVRFVEEGFEREGDAGSHVIDGFLVVVSDVNPMEVERMFKDPERATVFIAGARSGRPLWDPEGCFEEIRNRARAFVWDEKMQASADAHASRELAGWAEEAQKGLEGLKRGDPGRFLNARFGLSWGLVNVMRVQRGVLISSDNSFFSEVVADLGVDSEWAHLCRAAFGMEDPEGRPLPLEEQVRAGLRLYVLTAEMLDPILDPKDRPVIEHAKRLIEDSIRFETSIS